MMGMIADKGPLPDMRCADTWPRIVSPETETPISVTFGELPITWELLSGVNFSLKYPAATGRSNTLVAGPTSCGRCLVKAVDANLVECTCWTVSTDGSFQTESSTSCGGTTGESSPPQYIPISSLYRWMYRTDPEGTGFCTGDHPPCGYLNCGPLEDGYGKVCVLVCERWKCD